MSTPYVQSLSELRSKCSACICIVNYRKLSYFLRQRKKNMAVTWKRRLFRTHSGCCVVLVHRTHLHISQILSYILYFIIFIAFCPQILFAYTTHFCNNVYNQIYYLRIITVKKYFINTIIFFNIPHITVVYGLFLFSCYTKQKLSWLKLQIYLLIKCSKYL